MVDRSFEKTLAGRIADERVDLAARWLERLRQRLLVDERDIFPTDSLLDHIPSLIGEIAAFLEDPQDQAIEASTSVALKARELGTLRHEQSASLHQVMWEFRLLGAILEAFVCEQVPAFTPPPPPATCGAFVGRLYLAVGVLQQTAVDTFVTAYVDRIREDRERLESFSRIISHELRQPLGVLQVAVRLIAQGELSADGRRILGTVERNVSRIADMTQSIERMVRMQGPADSPIDQRVDLAALAAEVARQLRDMSEARGICVEVDERLPTVATDPARVELVLTNLVSNALKYHDPAKRDRFVRIVFESRDDERVTFSVRDNGVGIPSVDRDRIFARFARVHAHRDAELHVNGLGLGLSIVRESAAALGASVRVESAEGEGTVFFVTLPGGPPASHPAA